MEGANLRLIENPLKAINNRYEIDFEDFEAKIEKYHPAVYFTTNPHNPTGRVFTEEELTRLVDICARNKIKIISDEVHCLILYQGHKHTPILAVNDQARKLGIQIVSLSKGYNVMSLPHAIVTIAEPEMRKAWMRQMTAHSFEYATNSFALAAVTSILEGGADEWMKELNSYLSNNLQFALKYIEENKLPLKPYPPEAGFLLWLGCCDAGIGNCHLDRFFLEKAHIHLDDGEENFGSEGKGFVRINYAVPNKVLREAFERIKAALNTH